ncbi:MAG: type II toxin-antitoxin system RelE/ParE family toxin [Syntrophobacteraceae bacterium]|jgi:mRNA interferase RelE/StbE
MRLVVTEPAEKDLLDIDAKHRQRIRQAIERMLSDPRTSDLKKLKGQENTWRLRVGDWRVILEIDQAEGIIYAHRIKHRREAYR